MNNDEIKIITGDEIPFQLTQIPEPPKRLYIQGCLPRKNAKILCIVGSRRNSVYGEKAIKKLVSGLSGYNICIVSGLATGIDGIAHRAALEAGLQTIAFPGSGLDRKVLYPFKHHKLADEILYAGGGLISEYEMTLPAFKWTFPQRNRLMVGISESVLIVEAREKSGTLITSRLALDYNKNVCVLPGEITSALSIETNKLIREGAIPITCSDDILEILGFERRDVINRDIHSRQNFQRDQLVQKELLFNLNEKEKTIIELLQIESMTFELLISKTNFNAQILNESISSLEIQGLILEQRGKIYLR